MLGTPRVGSDQTKLHIPFSRQLPKTSQARHLKQAYVSVAKWHAALYSRQCDGGGVNTLLQLTVITGTVTEGKQLFNWQKQTPTLQKKKFTFLITLGHTNFNVRIILWIVIPTTTRSFLSVEMLYSEGFRKPWGFKEKLMYLYISTTFRIFLVFTCWKFRKSHSYAMYAQYGQLHSRDSDVRNKKMKKDGH